MSACGDSLNSVSEAALLWAGLRGFAKTRSVERRKVGVRGFAKTRSVGRRMVDFVPGAVPLAMIRE